MYYHSLFLGQQFDVWPLNLHIKKDNPWIQSIKESCANGGEHIKSADYHSNKFMSASAGSSLYYVL